MNLQNAVSSVKAGNDRYVNSAADQEAAIRANHTNSIETTT
jgi:hypothetical protein